MRIAFATKGREITPHNWGVLFLVELHSRTAARHLCSEDCISLSTYSKYERSHKPAQKEGLSSGREVSYAGTRSFPESNSMSCIAKLLGGCRFQS